MSVVLVTMEGAPKVSEEARKKDQELNELIDKKVQGEYRINCLIFEQLTNFSKKLEIVQKHNNEITINGLIQSLICDESLANKWPPGAGIEAK